MLPSGVTTGEAEAASDRIPPPGRFCVGSTPVVAPERQPPGCPLGGSRMLQPSSSRPSNEDDHCKLRSAVFTASRVAVRPVKWARLAVYRVVPSAEIAGARLSGGRCDPQAMEPGTAFGLGGHGNWFSEKVSRHVVGAPGIKL